MGTRTKKESRGAYALRLNREMQQRVGLTLAEVMTQLGRDCLPKWYEAGIEVDAVVDSIDFDDPRWDRFFR